MSSGFVEDVAQDESPVVITELHLARPKSQTASSLEERMMKVTAFIGEVGFVLSGALEGGLDETRLARPLLCDLQSSFG